MRAKERTSVNTSGLLAVLVVTLVLVGCQGQAPTESQIDTRPAGDLYTVKMLHDHPHPGTGPLLHKDTAMATTDPAIFNQGPSTGETAGCVSNQTNAQNFAEQFSLSQNMAVTGICIFTCLPQTAGTVHIKILADAGGAPGAFLFEEDMDPDSWSEVASGIYKVTALLNTPFNAATNTTYWVGVSGNGFELGQLTVEPPGGDGRMAGFNGETFDGLTGPIGDMMFQLTGGPATTTVTVEIDVKPFSDRCINLRRHRFVAVAILGSADFDVKEIDRSSVEFEGSHARQRRRCKSGVRFDVNRDGFVDLLVRFPVKRLDLTEADTEGVLTGSLLDGTTFEGSDSICVVNGSKTHKNSRRGRR